jgi:hypothetical protein
VSPMMYELGLCIPEDGVLHSHRRENLKSNILLHMCKFLVIAIPSFFFSIDRLCGVVIGVPGYRSRGSGLDSGRYQIF